MIRHSMIEYHFKEFLYNCISHTANVLLLFFLFLSSKHSLYLALFGLCRAILLFRISTSFPLFQIVVLLPFHSVLQQQNETVILLCEQKMDLNTLTECNSIFHLLLWCIPVTCCWPCIGCSSASSQVQRLLYMIQSL